jgi:3-oxoacyl-[acyl-carrier-protein] synthase-3
MAAYLAGFGRYLPPRAVTNSDVAAELGKTGDWIENVSGIRERRYASVDEGVVEMGVAAGADCLKRLGVSEVNMVIAASGSGASGFPGPAAAIAQGLGLGAIPALDVPIASAGSVFGLALAMHVAPVYGNVLLVGSEKMSTLIGKDPNTAILFGDGAGAALITNQPARWRLVDAVLHSNGQFRDALSYDGALHMDGKMVFLVAVRKMPEVMDELLKRNQLAASQVDAFLVHQANLNLLTRVAKTLEVDQTRFFVNIERYGNTSSASMLIAASEWEETKPTAKSIVFCGFGAGFHWGAVLATSSDSD